MCSQMHDSQEKEKCWYSQILRGQDFAIWVIVTSLETCYILYIKIIVSLSETYCEQKAKHTLNLEEI